MCVSVCVSVSVSVSVCVLCPLVYLPLSCTEKKLTERKNNYIDSHKQIKPYDLSMYIVLGMHMIVSVCVCGGGGWGERE